MTAFQLKNQRTKKEEEGSKPSIYEGHQKSCTYKNVYRFIILEEILQRSVDFYTDYIVSMVFYEL